jgi:hypothetical protein
MTRHVTMSASVGRLLNSEVRRNESALPIRGTRSVCATRAFLRYSIVVCNSLRRTLDVNAFASQAEDGLEISYRDTEGRDIDRSDFPEIIDMPSARNRV